METLEQLKARILQAVPEARVEIMPNDSPCGQSSLLIGAERAAQIAAWLRDDPELHLDYCSNVTGVDWPETKIKTKTRKTITTDGVAKEIEEVVEAVRPGYLEVVYHLYSMARKHGPVILRLRTEDRCDKNHVPSLTAVWRGCELQEREVYDLYGVVFDGHPDLRRILMWEGFKDHPMRKDYVEPDDYDYEPTPHDEVLAKAKRHREQEVKA